MTRSTATLFERVASLLLTVSAIGMAVALVRREFLVPAAPVSVRAEPEPPKFIVEWPRLLAHSLEGRSTAEVQIIVFSDLECPFCRRYYTTLKAIAQEYGARVHVNFVHFPLPSHRFARVTAQAAECAAIQGRADPFIEAAYGKQDSLGLKTWASFARDAGIADTFAFTRCVEKAPTFARIDSGLAIGREIGVRGTPTVLLNGWLLEVPPPKGELTRAIEAVLKGRSPFSPATGSQ